VSSRAKLSVSALAERKIASARPRKYGLLLRAEEEMLLYGQALAISPDVILLPFLGEGTSRGLKTPLFDTHSIKQGGPMAQFSLWDDPRFSPVVTLVLDPTQKIFQ
jgi:hypothetical protein